MHPALAIDLAINKTSPIQVNRAFSFMQMNLKLHNFRIELDNQVVVDFNRHFIALWHAQQS